MLTYVVFRERIEESILARYGVLKSLDSISGLSVAERIPCRAWSFTYIPEDPGTLLLRTQVLKTTYIKGVRL